MASLLTCIRGLIGLWFRRSSPVRAFIWRSKYSRYSLPSLSVFKTMFPNGVLFVLHICEGQSESCCLATQYLLELAVNLIQATFCQIESQFPRLHEPLWLLVCFRIHVAWVAFVSLSTRLLFLKSLSLSFAVTGATQMAFNTGRNSAERWRFIVLSSLSPCS